jgi:hypothetical protein
MKLTGRRLFAPTGITIITRTIARHTAIGGQTISLMAYLLERDPGSTAFTVVAVITGEATTGGATTVAAAITAGATMDGATTDAAMGLGAAEAM